MLACNLHGIFRREIHIRLIQNHHTLLRATQNVQISDGITPPAGRVRRGHECQGCLKIPLLARAEFFDGRQTEIRRQRHFVSSGVMNVRQHGIQRIAWGKILHAIVPWLYKRARGQSQQFVRTISHNHIFNTDTVQFRQPSSQPLCGGVRIQTQPPIHGLLCCRQDFGGWRIRILVGVELY